ncbi:MAG: tetratricopeptide repeat protein [Chitinophagales bacterium]|nr:tetratricopeptide repeat protein [Chitinophagales bacterium]MCZ2392490.1 tetratricopeptide repeat protein [Chitinophagales bacterium]
MNLLKKYFIFILFCFISFNTSLIADEIPDDMAIAMQFFEQGEYAKAIDYFKKLANSEASFFDIYDSYIQSLRVLNDVKGEEALIHKAYLISGKNPLYLFQLALLYDRIGDEKNVQKQLAKSLQAVKNNSFQIQQITLSLIELGKFEWAQKVYFRGREVFKNPDLYTLELAYIQGKMGNYEGMVISFIQYLSGHPNDISSIIHLLDTDVEDPKKAEILESQLLIAIGKNKADRAALEMLVWLYKKQEDYASALDQIRSLDLLRNGNGAEVLEVARLAYREKDYKTAAKAYKYIIERGINYPYYSVASLELISTQKAMVLQKKNYTQDDLMELKGSYLRLIGSPNQASQIAMAKIDLADLEARYFFHSDSAISILDGLIHEKGISKDIIANAKLDLGDYYIMNEEPWEAILLYTQVAKEFKGTPTGEEAKFRNARLSYFKGDFEWALTQLKVIKGNTFELISNDAIELASFISDNYNQDYEEDKVAMKSYSEMDLLFFENKLQQANQLADMMLLNFPGHPLEDDIYFMKAKISSKLQDFDSKEKFLLKIIEQFPTSILADNAVFQLAELYEYQLNLPDKAMSFFEKILLDYPDSIFTIEARKRYRFLRGDKL